MYIILYYIYIDVLKMGCIYHVIFTFCRIAPVMLTEMMWFVYANSSC